MDTYKRGNRPAKKIPLLEEEVFSGAGGSRTLVRARKPSGFLHAYQLVNCRADAG